MVERQINRPFLDRKTKILCRSSRAVKLGFIEFKIISTLIDNHALKKSPMNAKDLQKIIWPASWQTMSQSAFGVILHHLNRKLKYVSMHIIAYHPFENRRARGKEYTLALTRWSRRG